MNIIETSSGGFSLLSDLNQYTTLTPKQIRNRARQFHPRFPNLIIGGGRGHIGKYWVHFSAIPMLTERKYKKTDNIYILRQRMLSERLYFDFTWNYFGCIRPAYDIDEKILVDAIRGLTCFWVIHRLNDVNHLHFALNTKQTVGSIQLHLTSYFRQQRIRADNPQIESFKDYLKQPCYDYCVGREAHAGRTDVINWGINVRL